MSMSKRSRRIWIGKQCASGVVEAAAMSVAEEIAYADHVAVVMLGSIAAEVDQTRRYLAEHARRVEQIFADAARAIERGENPSVGAQASVDIVTYSARLDEKSRAFGAHMQVVAQLIGREDLPRLIRDRAERIQRLLNAGADFSVRGMYEELQNAPDASKGENVAVNA